MNWSGLQTVLAAQVASVAGCPAYWEPVSSTWQETVRVLLSVLSVRKLGWDETRQRYDATGDMLLPRQYGVRAVTVTVKVESRDQNLAASAGALAEQVRTRLGRPAVLEALRAVDLAVSSTTDVRVVDRSDPDRGRLVSYGLFEAVFLTHVSDEEDAPADLGYIETVEVTQTIDPVQDEVLRVYRVSPLPPEEDP